MSQRTCQWFVFPRSGAVETWHVRAAADRIDEPIGHQQVDGPGLTTGAETILTMVDRPVWPTNLSSSTTRLVLIDAQGTIQTPD